MSGLLAERGHPHTTVCSVDPSALGLGRLPFIQFEQHDNRDEDLQESTAILQLLAGALVDSGVRYIGFEGARSWTTCQSRDPEYIFWRDYNDNWRYMSEKPIRYLSELEGGLAADQRGTVAEAYLLWSLGVVEQRLDRRSAGLDNFEKAHAILQDSNDPDRIMAYVLIPLIHHHLGEDGDAQKGQSYLEEFALISESSSVEGAYLPLIKDAPVYPRGAQRRGIEGYVLLEFTVDAEGRVQDPIVIEESPAGVLFGDASIEAAQSFRYVPRVVNGVRVSTKGVRNKITFGLQN